MKELGVFLKKLRRESGKSLTEIYVQTGITDSKLWRIEKGLNESGPSCSTLMALADCYNASIVELYLLAGYLDKDSLTSYQRVFKHTELLKKEEFENIQKQIDLFVAGRQCNDF